MTFHTQEERNTEKFMEFVRMYEQWFKDENMEVTDSMLGRMASRLQQLFSQQQAMLIKQLEGIKDKEYDCHDCLDTMAAIDDAIAKIRGSK